MFQPIMPFEKAEVLLVPEASGVYIVYDLAGPIYVGRSALNIRRRLLTHLEGRGNKNIAMALSIGAASSLSFSFCLLPRADQAHAEAVLIEQIGAIKFANLRRETSQEDWEPDLAGQLLSDAKKIFPE